MGFPSIIGSKRLLLGTLGIVALVLGGCSKRPEKPTKAPSLTQPLIGDVSYQRHCITDARCSDNEALAAVYDYLGAVYINSTNIDYDGNSTSLERYLVEARLQRLTQRSAIDDYFSYARSIFSKAHQVPGSFTKCITGSVTYEKLDNETDGEAFVLSGNKDCGSLYGAIYFTQGLEGIVATNPRQWVFLIEGIDQESEQRILSTALFYRIAQELGIPIHDPVVSLSSSEVVRSLRDKYDISKEVWVASHFIVSRMEQLDRINGRALSGMNLGQQKKAYHDFVHHVLNEKQHRQARQKYARDFGLSERKFRSICKKILMPARGIDSISHFFKLVKDINEKVYPAAVEAANRETLDNIKLVLMAEQKRRALYVLPPLYLHAVRQAYHDGSD